MCCGITSRTAYHIAGDIVPYAFVQSLSSQRSQDNFVVGRGCLGPSPGLVNRRVFFDIILITTRNRVCVWDVCDNANVTTYPTYPISASQAFISRVHLPIRSSADRCLQAPGYPAVWVSNRICYQGWNRATLITSSILTPIPLEGQEPSDSDPLYFGLVDKPQRYTLEKKK